MNDFLAYLLYLLQRSVHVVLPAVLLCAAALAAAWGIRRRQGRPFSWKRALLLLLLVGWLGLTLYATLLRSPPGARQWNLQLFLAWREAWNQFGLRVWLNVLLNIALFIPFGMLLPLLLPIFRRWYAALSAGFAGSLAIELAQLATARGMFDVDDLFTNTLGTMAGWGLIMAAQTVHLRDPGWKKAVPAYLSAPAALVLVLGGIFTCYTLQPYGNLPESSSSTADLSQIQWELTFSPSDTPASAAVYLAGRIDQAASQAFCEDFARRVGVTFPDVDYYDDTVWFGNHSTGDFLLLSQLDGTWEYTIGRENTPVFNVLPGQIRPEDIRAVLDAWGIATPEQLQLTIEPSGGDGFYTAASDVQLFSENGALFYGSLSCSLYGTDGATALDRIEYRFAALTPQKEEPILTPAQAVQALYGGHSFYGKVLEHAQPERVTLRSCTLDWMADTKGYYQPVYRLELQVQDQGSFTDYVPALLG